MKNKLKKKRSYKYNVFLRLWSIKPGAQKVVNIIFTCALFLTISASALDIHGDFTVGLGGIPASFDDSINEGESGDGRSYINNYYHRDGFMGNAHFATGDGVYPDILSTEGSITNGCTITVQNWVDYSPKGKEAEIKISAGAVGRYFIGLGTESENPDDLTVRSAFDNYLDSCRPSFSLDPDNVSSTTLTNPAEFISIDSSGILTVNVSGVGLNDGETADITVYVTAGNGYGSDEGTINITVASAVLTVNLVIDGTPLHGGAQGTAEVNVTTPSETQKVTWVGKSKEFIITDRAKNIDFEAVDDRIVFEFVNYTGDIEKLTPSFSASFNQLAGDAATKKATVTANFKVSNRIIVNAWTNGPGYINPEEATVQAGESVTISALEANSHMWFWEITDGDQTSYVDVDSVTLNGREEFNLTITPQYNTNVVAYFGSIKDPAKEPPDPPEGPDDPPEDEDDEKDKKKPKDPNTGGMSWPPLPGFDDFDLGDLPDPGDLDDFTLDDYIHIMLEWDMDGYPPPSWYTQLELVVNNLGDYNDWPDVNVYIENANELLNNNDGGNSGGGNSGGGGSDFPYIFTTGTPDTSVLESGSSKNSNAALGAAGLGGILFLQLHKEVYKPYWSHNKPTKTAPVRPEY